MHMHHILQTVAYLALPNFPTLSYKRQFIWESLTEHKICFDFQYNICLKHISFYEVFSEIFTLVYKRLHVKYRLFLSYFKEFELSGQGLECTPFCLIKICLVRAELLHAGGLVDGRTDRHDEANCRFPQFCECVLKWVHIRPWKVVSNSDSMLHSVRRSNCCSTCSINRIININLTHFTSCTRLSYLRHQVVVSG
jgi:hypothetical protein